MAKYALKRFGMALITLLFVICLTFILINSIPGSPWIGEKSPSAATVAAMNEKYGLDKPPAVQLEKYLVNLVKGDFGVSLKMQQNRPVTEIIMEKFPISAAIGFIAFIWAIALGLPLGCLAAYKRGTWIDGLFQVICTIGVSVPSFVVASLLITTFAGGNVHLRLFPTIFNASLGVKAYILPCFTLGIYPMCYLARQTKAAMLDTLSQDYIRTARAKGLKNSTIIFKHALRNALIPVITYIGPDIAFVFCGSFAVESVFSVPGLGRYFIQSIQNRDYPVIMGTTVFFAAFLILMNFFVDVFYKVVDPRIDLTDGGK